MSCTAESAESLAPQVMDCTMVYIPMAHGLYNGWDSVQIPWVMDCTAVYLLHGLWAVQ